MVGIKYTEGKKTPNKLCLDVKDCFFTEDGHLTDVDGTDVLATIQQEMPEDVKAFSFKINFVLPDKDEEE